MDKKRKSPCSDDFPETQISSDSPYNMDNMDTEQVNNDLCESVSGGENDSTIENKDTLKAILAGISDIKITLSTMSKNMDKHELQINQLFKNIHGKHGIEQRLQSVCDETNDQTSDISNLNGITKKSLADIELLKSYIIRLEQKVDDQHHTITDIQRRAMRDNIILTGLKEQDRENLKESLADIFKHKLEIDHDIKIDRVHRIGPKISGKSAPRAVVAKLHDNADKELILGKGKMLPQGIRVSPQFPDQNRQNRKRLYDVQKQFDAKGVKSKIKGDKLVFLSNGQTYREPVKCPKAASVFDKSIKSSKTYRIYEGDTLSDNGNFISARAASVHSINEAREVLREMLKLPSVARSMHNIMAYRLVDEKGVLHEGTDDDGEHGAGSTVLSFLRDNGYNSVLVVVSRVFGSKLGPKRFRYFTDAAQSALHRVGTAATSTVV